MGPLEIEAWFQPITCLKTGKPVGFEALARPMRGGDVPSDEWLNHGLLAETMLAQAATALATLSARPGYDHLGVQVNLTTDDLKLKDLPRHIAALRQRHGLAPGRLAVEITEHLPIADMAGAMTTLLEIKAAGAGLVLDDFGSGYSSLSWLHDLPVDGLKIDGELTRKLGSARGNVILAHAVQLGHALGLCVTAEGVEDLDQGRQLRAIGVDQVQGFAYGRPMRIHDAVAALSGTGAAANETVEAGGWPSSAT